MFTPQDLSPSEQTALFLKKLARNITHVALLLRMTPQERKAIKERRLTDDDVEDIMYIMEKAEHIGLDDPVTVHSLNVLFQKGLFEEGRVEAILSAEVQDSERPG